ncbi:MAG TPA: hypothetical protein VLI41_11455 [Phenylobacterium sp.]|uniref:hypothetical protein n=1 Tax=Phenylobacterium sp. TaxID=1871053 RepID=UPI002BA1D92E|nr:hypothetical protein [Phenylobacterium sp.]HSV03808.1 hypothetical protein [Phenylobacterium sp.]
MRYLMMAAGITAAMLVSACQQSSSEAQETAPKPRDLGRSQVFYQGQGLIEKIDSATIVPAKTAGVLALKVSGTAAGPGYTDPEFVPRIYPAAPPDGVYEIDVVATKPANAAAKPTAIEVKTDWQPKRPMKAVRFMSATNHVEVPMPAN